MHSNLSSKFLQAQNKTCIGIIARYYCLLKYKLYTNHMKIYFYWQLPGMCTVFNLEANSFQLYQGAHEVADIIK